MKNLEDLFGDFEGSGVTLTSERVTTAVYQRVPQDYSDVDTQTGHVLPSAPDLNSYELKIRASFQIVYGKGHFMLHRDEFSNFQEAFLNWGKKKRDKTPAEISKYGTPAEDFAGHFQVNRERIRCVCNAFCKGNCCPRKEELKIYGHDGRIVYVEPNTKVLVCPHLSDKDVINLLSFKFDVKIAV